MGSSSRTPYKFQTRFCEGHKDAMGYWKADGASELAETELKKRLELVMIKRERSELWAEQPEKVRRVIRIEGKKPEKGKVKFDSEDGMYKELERLLPETMPAVVENVMQSLVLGEKTVIWVLTRESVRLVAQAIEKATSARNVGTKMRDVKFKLFTTSGETAIPERFKLCAEFANHKGAAVLIATQDSVTVSISLYSRHLEHACYTQHYAQMHYLPGILEQSENRVLLKDSIKITIFYYIVKGSVAERLEKLVLPRLIAADKVVGSKDAASTAAVLAPVKESFSDFLARLTENALEDAEIDSEDDD